MQNKNEDKITVVVPCYNVEDYVERCIDSLLNQDFKYGYKIIAINDGSKDGTINKLNKYKDKLYKIIDNPNNGVAYTRRLGAELADTKYVVFVDSDDYVEPNYLSTLYNNVTEDVVPFVCRTCMYPNRQVKILEEEKTYDFIGITEQILNHKTVCTFWRTIFEREKFLKVKMNNLTYCEDVVYILEYFKNNNLKVKVLPELVYNYNYCNVNSATSSFYTDWHLKSFLVLPLKLKEFLYSEELDRKTKKIIVKALNRSLIFSLVRVYRIVDYKSFKQIYKQDEYRWFKRNGRYCTGNIGHKFYFFAFKHNMFFLIKLLESTLFKKKNNPNKVSYLVEGA